MHKWTFQDIFMVFLLRRWLNNPHNVSQSQWTVKISCFCCTLLGAQDNQREWYIHRQGIFCMPSSLIRYDCQTVMSEAKVSKFDPDCQQHLCQIFKFLITNFNLWFNLKQMWGVKGVLLTSMWTDAWQTTELLTTNLVQNEFYLLAGQGHPSRTAFQYRSH